MADPDALRSRRYRAHRQGSHHLCKHWPEANSPRAEGTYPTVGEDEDFDPAAEMAALAGRLKAAYAREPGNAALARELRMTLHAMTSPPASTLFDDLQRWLSGPD